MDFSFIVPNSVPLAQADFTPPAGTPQWLTGGNLDPAAMKPASDIPGPYWFNGLGRELNFLLSRASIAPDNTKYTLIADAVAALIAQEAAARHQEISTAITNESNARSAEDSYFVNQLTNLFGTAGLQQDITNASLLLAAVDNEARRYGGGNFVRVTQSGTLDANQLGMVVIDASAGPITLTLPAANCFASAKAVPRPGCSAGTARATRSSFSAPPAATAIPTAPTTTAIRSDTPTCCRWRPWT